MQQQFMAIDQFGDTFHGLSHPRKDLLERLDRKHADKMYTGKGIHIGYIIAGHWLKIYRVNQWKDPSP